jgi:hypothetical protein
MSGPAKSQIAVLFLIGVIDRSVGTAVGATAKESRFDFRQEYEVFLFSTASILVLGPIQVSYAMNTEGSLPRDKAVGARK